MSPQQDNIGQSRSSSLTGESRISGCGGTEEKKIMKSLAQRRQSAPSLVISKALSKSRSLSRESCLSPVSPEFCPLVQSIISPSRTLLIEGHAQLKTGLQTQDRHLFLFNDVFVIAKSKSASHFKLKKQVKVCEVWMASCMDEVCEGTTNPELSFVMGWPTTNCVATFSSPEQKEKWLSCLYSCIKEEKEKEHPKSIPLKIVTRNVGSCIYSKVLTVNNTDTAYDVVTMTLQQFGITGNPKDYQLWVISGKEDAPYPLIGHEYPFSIKMSHIQNAAAQTQSSKDSLYPLDFQGPFIIEQLPVEMQCQFILKPSRLASCQQMAETSQKQCKRKRSIMNWTFWRGLGTQLDNMPLSPTSMTPGRLFGLPLSAICEDDHFPKPIMDMLSFLFREGPFTRGIFRRSANAKACKELKEKLNTGAEVHLARESVFVTAAVFKDFLRNIPGSIFTSDLYDDWLAAIEKRSHEEKIKEIQRLLEQLPKLNSLLLRHVFRVLHNIEQQAEENQMNAFNLAVCIAPSILWPPTPCSPEIESESTKKVALFVQFLIENCCRIFGDGFMTSFGALSSRKYANRDDGSDLSSFQLHDSSYDSLENELNHDTDSPLLNLMSKRKQDNQSRDSVLTWSDCDLDQPEDEGSHLCVPASQSRSVSCPFSENDLLDSNIYGFAPDRRLSGSRRHRRCSEPNIFPPASQFAQHCQNHETVIRKASYDAVMTQSDENYLMQLQMLQIEGQKLINYSLHKDIDQKTSSNGSHKVVQKVSHSSSQLQPPPPLKLNVTSKISSSSLSSPSGSSMSSIDSAFTHNAEPCVLDESFSTSTSAIQGHKGHPAVVASPSMLKHCYGVLSPIQDAGTAVTSSSAAPEKHKGSCNLTEETSKCIIEKGPVTLHPNSWLKKGGCWTLRRKEKGYKLKSKHGPFFIDKELTNGKLTVSPVAAEDVQKLNRSRLVNSLSYRKPIQSSLQSTDAKKKGVMVKSSKLLLKHGHSDSQELINSSVACRSHLLSTANRTLPELDQIPQTIFYGQNSKLCLQSKPRQQSRSFTLGEKCSQRVVNSHLSELVTSAHTDTQSPGAISESVTNTDLSEIQGGILQEKKPFSSTSGPCATEQQFHSTSSNALSHSAAKAVKDYFFQIDAENYFMKTQEVTDAVLQSKKKWQNKCCSDPKFEDFEQVFFSEESYV
ncbi:rho GTPase-activating protein 20-like isoform X1 [Hemiscyllium ocellatum]|uniref:rho GTPase-activating protein 20-like isoform X1 n=1 Tax=Hemiscyllium ocellatum TaxID=170820 RepID=UPI0029672454|nr:rho GTPase-activating protein 20-like isoform X1 [Hemiscyllium ocellatum]